jgi:hypothetical protein
MILDINERERDFLLEILKTEHSSLLDELLHTDSYDYKELIKQKIELLKVLKSRVEASLPESTTI